MLIAIGVADGIHIYNHLHLYMLEHPNSSKADAVKDVVKGMWKPVMMTSVTTAVGFISLLTSQVYPIKYFGLFTAFGVMVAMLFSLLLIPASILAFGLPRWKKTKIKKEDDLESDKLSKMFSHKILQYKGLIIAVTIVVILISLYGISKVWINSSFLDKFEKDSDIVKTDKFINDHFGGTSTLNVILISDKKNAFKNPEILKLLDKMQEDTESELEVVGNSFSLADYLKRMNKVMHADKEEFNKIPSSSDLIAQYLLLYEMSGDPDNLWKVVDYNYQKANVVFQLKKDDSKSINSAIKVIEKYKEPFEKLGVKIKYAGSGYKALVFTDLILKGQIMSLVMSLILILILLSLMFKSISVGFIGSVPIIITALIGFGVMGLFNIPLSTTTALLSSIAVGIGIDYAVHFIERYKIYAKETNDQLISKYQKWEKHF
jgi:predicted RND superfamily exporter protein